MRYTPLEQKIAEIATPVIEDLGFAFVHIAIKNDSGAQNVQIMAEDPATKRLGVDDCAKISRAVAALLDVEDPINGAYRLELSSPGIDRPLTRLEDYVTYETYVAKLEAATPMPNGQKKFRGTLKGLKKDGDHDMVLIDTDQGPYEIPYLDIVKAKLVLTDELIKRTANA